MKKELGKPYPEFPLTPHASGKWPQKIKGRVYYFGRWDDPQSALQEYLKAHEYLQAGVPVPGGNTMGMLSVGELCDQFYGAKNQAVIAGGLTTRSLKDLRRTCTRLCSFVGKTRATAPRAEHTTRITATCATEILS